MNENIPENYLGFMKEKILSHKSLLVQHEKIYNALRKLLISDANAYIISTKDICLMEIMAKVNNASALNESLFNAFTAFIDDFFNREFLRKQKNIFKNDLKTITFYSVIYYNQSKLLN